MVTVAVYLYTQLGIYPSLLQRSIASLVFLTKLLLLLMYL